ncbi:MULTISPECIES: hypothetical protein [unclassified Streptomyces]|uniref:hypothetical protein n=1 Tax=unclassified Streptomyces TaxID=2593676 RepID=UPI000B1EF109|nr:hypothetical protein [Streptomyces sp. TSRI0107]
MLSEWTRALDWLAAAAKDPRACRDDWQHGVTGIHLLAAGRQWDVLTVPERLGLYAADLLEALPGVAPGPVLLDARGHRVGFLVPPEPAALWAGHDVRYVTEGGWIAAPAPHCRWGALHWLVPPDGSGTLTPPLLLEYVLDRALRELTRAHGGPLDRHLPPRRRDEPALSANGGAGALPG